MTFMMKWTFFLVFLYLSTSSFAQQESAAFYFNEGNKSMSNNQMDEALYNYEKAAILEPNANDIYNNIQVAKEKLSVDIVEVPPIFLSKWWSVFTGSLKPGHWKILTILVLIFLIAFVYSFLFGPYFISKSKNKLGIYFCLALLLLFISAGISRHNDIFHNEYAVVIGDEMQLKEGPDQVSKDVKAITGGVKLKIEDAAGEWYKVIALDKEHGWILKKDVRLLRFD